MVYIDAEHEYTACFNDCEMWYKKLKKGGILCGHDFTLTTESSLSFIGRNIKIGVGSTRMYTSNGDVATTVINFASKINSGLEIHLEMSDDQNRIFYEWLVVK
jgi:hypothetical protein